MKGISVPHPFCNSGSARLVISHVIDDQQWVLCLTILTGTVGLLGLFTVYLGIHTWQMRRALQWWSRQQSRQLWLHSERIRNGLLQEVFTLRRTIELSQTDGDRVTNDDSQHWLERLGGLYADLETLSDRLSPAYLGDSLPLAIQTLLHQSSSWPNQGLQNLPTDWPQEPPERSRIILAALQELLEIALLDQPTTLAPCLSLSVKNYGGDQPWDDQRNDKNWGELIVQVIYPDCATAIALAQSQELVYLGRSFRCLMSGRYRQHRQGCQIRWQLVWPLSGRMIF